MVDVGTVGGNADGDGGDGVVAVVVVAWPRTPLLHLLAGRSHHPLVDVWLLMPVVVC